MRRFGQKPQQLSLPLFPQKSQTEISVNKHSSSDSKNVKLQRQQSTRPCLYNWEIPLCAQTLSKFFFFFPGWGWVLLWFNMPAALPHHTRNPRGCQTTAALFWVAHRQFAPPKSDRLTVQRCSLRISNATGQNTNVSLWSRRGVCIRGSWRNAQPRQGLGMFLHMCALAGIKRSATWKCVIPHSHSVCDCVYFFSSFFLSRAHLAADGLKLSYVNPEKENTRKIHFHSQTFTGDRACSLSLWWLRPPPLCKCDVVKSRLHILALSRRNGAQSVPPSRLQ